MATTVKKAHPIRGALWGVMLGVGLSLVLVITKVIYLELVPIVIVMVAAIAIGVLWGLFAPAKPPKGPEPVPVEQTHAPESSRFDDFGDSDRSAPAPPDGTEAADEAARVSAPAENDLDAPAEQPGDRSDPPPAS